MPYETTFFQLPCGARCFRLEAKGTLSGEDAAEMIRQVEPGGELYGLPCLILTRDMTSISPEARRRYAARGDVGDRETFTAVVVTNPVIRVSARFIMRIQRSRRTDLFATEEKALEWLDARVREDMAARKGAP
ncbi:MAG TPA: hypothetical protein VFB81_07260 [Myxococcales bacterium]|nr:hypothetical protein [Myxococcales bacterium]